MALLQLKTMKAVQDHWRNPFVHCYLWLEDAAGKHWVVEGYPEKIDGVEYLRTWIYEGETGHWGLSMARMQQRAWTYHGEDVAGAVERVLAAAREFPPGVVRYRMLQGPNSNTYVRWLSVRAGVEMPRPDFAVAWEAEILGV